MMTTTALGWLAWMAVPVLSWAAPSAYACHLHPLARLSREVEEGMPVGAVLDRFESYASRSGPEGGGVAVLGDIHPTGGGEVGKATRILFIQDLWEDEDLILTAWFDGEGEVQGARFQCGPGPETS